MRRREGSFWDVRRPAAWPPTIVAADEAAALIPNDATVGVLGASGFVVPESVLEAIERRFLAEGAPRGVTLVFSSGIGDRSSHIGVDRLAHSGLLRRAIAGHYGDSPQLGSLALAGEIEAYNFPQGVITQLFREIAAGRPGLVTHVGLHTYVDPRLEGGKVRPDAEDLAEVVSLGGAEWLFFPALPLDVAIIRGTTADEDGNITMEREALTLDVLSMAQAARNSGGIVIAQVERLAQRGSLSAREVEVPGILVDYVVLDREQRQGYAQQYNPGFSGELRVPAPAERLAQGPRRVIASRAASELVPGVVVNVGVGLAAGVAAIAAEFGIDKDVVFTIEQGLVGGVPSFGENFGTAVNQHALVDQPYQFDFYDGGGLDIAFVSFAEIDHRGDVNATRFGSRLSGCGGFIDITQNARTVVFCGTFTAGGIDAAVQDGILEIRTEGRHRKFVDAVQQVSFNAQYALACGQRVVYVSERAVFELTPAGIELIEIAPGIDLEKDVLELMDFEPLIREPLPTIDARFFTVDEGSLPAKTIPPTPVAQEVEG